MNRELHEQNRRSWNAATVAHNSHKGDQAAWLRSGGDSLFPEELSLLGDLDGVHLVHLQCNSGQDTLCLARRGARCVGVDISDEAIRFARQLSADSGIPAEFERADVYDWLDQAASSGRAADVVFASYGALVWLSDLDRWARGIAGVLRPGGRLEVVEMHPAGVMLGDDLRPAIPYRTYGKPMAFDGIGDYVAASGSGLTHGAEYHEGVVDFQNPHPSWQFSWGISDVITAVLEAGMRLTAFREWPYVNGCAILPNMRLEGRRYYPPEGVPDLPLMYGLSAVKPPAGA